MIIRISQIILKISLIVPLVFPLTIYGGYLVFDKNGSINSSFLLTSLTIGLVFMIIAVEITAQKTIVKINKINILLEETVAHTLNKAPKIYRKELIELLFEQPYSKIEYVVNALGVERKAASRYLKKLEEINVIKSQKIGRETIYVNTKLFELLKED
jgi:hypothetical protein